MNMTRGEQLADAYVAVAKADHYMVGIVEPVTGEEQDEAEQILIRWENIGWRFAPRALDVLANHRKMQRNK
jgi:hypothetical protein